MIALPDITTPPQMRLPIDQMDMGMDLLRTVHAGMQDHTFVDRDALLALSGTMFVAIDILQPVRSLLNEAHRLTPAKQISSPLLEAIKEYRAGCAAFKGWESRYPTEDCAIAKTYGRSMSVLSVWKTPVESLEEVREAVRLALTERAISDELVSEPLRAALTYLEKVTGWKEQEGETE